MELIDQRIEYWRQVWKGCLTIQKIAWENKEILKAQIFKEKAEAALRFLNDLHKIKHELKRTAPTQT